MDDIKINKHPTVQGYDLHHWPEFQAFAKRLGIEYENPTKDMNIFIPVEGSVVITQEYLGMDTKVLKAPMMKFDVSDVEVTPELKAELRAEIDKSTNRQIVINHPKLEISKESRERLELTSPAPVVDYGRLEQVSRRMAQKIEDQILGIDSTEPVVEFDADVPVIRIEKDKK